MPKPSISDADAKRKRKGKKDSDDEFEFLNRDINGADFASLLDGSKDEAGANGEDSAQAIKDREAGGDGQAKVDTE